MELRPDPAYDPGKSWWQKLITQVNDWWNSISTGEKVCLGLIFVAVSIGIAYATAGGSIGPEAELLSSIAAASTLSTAAQTALIELSIGIGVSIGFWALNAALIGNWDTNALGNDIADAVFFTGLFMFISAGVNALKYVYRSDPYPIPERRTNYQLANRGLSKGEHLPQSLNQQLALEETMSNPTAGKKLPIAIADKRWNVRDGWIKMQRYYNLYNGEKFEIHYVINESMKLMDDFKFKI